MVCVPKYDSTTTLRRLFVYNCLDITGIILLLKGHSTGSRGKPYYNCTGSILRYCMR